MQACSWETLRSVFSRSCVHVAWVGPEENSEFETQRKGGHRGQRRGGEKLWLLVKPAVAGWGLPANHFFLGIFSVSSVALCFKSLFVLLEITALCTNRPPFLLKSDVGFTPTFLGFRRSKDPWKTTAFSDCRFHFETHTGNTTQHNTESEWERLRKQSAFDRIANALVTEYSPFFSSISLK